MVRLKCGRTPLFTIFLIPCMVLLKCGRTPLFPLLRQLSESQRDRLKTWMTYSHVKLHDRLEIASVGHGQGLGFVAREKIPPGALLFSVPARIAISARSTEISFHRLRDSVKSAGSCPFDLQVWPAFVIQTRNMRQCHHHIQPTGDFYSDDSDSKIILFWALVLR